ncbi:ankyrin repeat domain-containing protein [Patulibacter sp. NPDC049589]|uniref:ankyrin repeat domain-containing protein n=1 Tax=Patulibacter sp. NPDC049589 TaxID=3154731 RepID=UPI003432E053
MATGASDRFEAARRAIDAHDLDALRDLLDVEPALVGAEGPNRNDLVSMAAGTCDDRTVALLLERGADPAHANVHGWTALHQAAYVGAVHLVGPLVAGGARTDGSARGDGGTPLVVALFWGHRDTADALVAAGGVTPGNLRAAAGAGDRRLVARLVGSGSGVGSGAVTAPGPGGEAGPGGDDRSGVGSGAVTAPGPGGEAGPGGDVGLDGEAGPGGAVGPGSAGAHRAFHRPHSEFPAWTPGEDRQEVLDEALAYAARNGRDEVMADLVAAGARPDADVYRGTPLIWAAWTGRSDTVRALLDLGADTDRRGTFGGPDHGCAVTPLHLAAQQGRAEVVRVLLAAGADRDAVDGHGHGPPAGWARHGGHDDVAALLEG